MSIVYKTQLGTPVTDSLKVAESFGRKHKSVLKSIRALLGRIPSISGSLWLTKYIDVQGKGRPYYLMKRDAFTLLTEKITSEEALRKRAEIQGSFDMLGAGPVGVVVTEKKKKEKLGVISRSMLLNEEIDIYGTPDNPMFLASDVARWIGHTNVAVMVRSVDESERQKRSNHIYTSSVPSSKECEKWYLTEEGLYEVLMMTRKPKAKQFKKGIKTILNSIRQTGGYIATKESDSDEDIMARALIVAQKTLERRNRQIAEQAEQLKLQQPKVVFADSVATSKDCILIGELALLLRQNGVEIGQTRLFQWLRDMHYLCSFGEKYNQPTQKAMEMGLFEVRLYNVTMPNGETRLRTTTKVTGKGQQYFVNKFLNA